MILASMLAMVMLAASPALAQTQSSEQNASGNNINQLSQQCQNVIGDITVEGGDNNAAISDDDANAAVGGDASGDQYQYGDNAGGDAAVSDDDVNAIAQENNTTVTVVQNCIQEAQQANVDIDANIEAPAPGDDQYADNGDDQYADNGDDQYADNGDDAAGAAAGAGVAGDDDDAAGAAAAGTAESDDAEGGAVAVLPDTGGASLFTLGAGALLVAGGLLARKIVR